MGYADRPKHDALRRRGTIAFVDSACRESPVPIVQTHGKRAFAARNGGGDNIEPVDLKKALEERYLAYALSTIMHRALPDVRDGLKPVHRRIMHAMRLLRLNPDQGFTKCARIVGEVMGKFHPHGDQSIYDALVRLAQDFSVRYPLVDGQGNFGNIDGDNAAAMRYTEARMTDVAAALLEGITEDAVDFRPTYNEEDEEPVVLPGAFPEPARQRLVRHRGRHGDLDPAAQCRRALRRSTSPDRQSGGLGHRSDDSPSEWERIKDDPERGSTAWCAVPTSRPAASSSTSRASIVDGLRDRPRRLSRAREMAAGGPGPRHLEHRRHRNPLSACRSRG